MSTYKLISHSEFRKAYVEFFSQFVVFLQKHEITFSLGFGSLLGAVREKKMIDWDYDIDIFIERGELEKLKACAQDLPKTFSLRSFGFGLWRIYISGLMQLYDNWFIGVYFDLFEFINIDGQRLLQAENACKKTKKAINRLSQMQTRRNPLFLSLAILNKTRYGNDPIGFFERRITGRFNCPESGDISLLFHGGAFPKQDFYVMTRFEWFDVPIMNNFETVLESIYGLDYMTPKKRSVDGAEHYYFFVERREN